ncbi:hypothetical protein AB0O67_33370 [Streptomyces sp. NPDC086077]|uniref:hypothetical protein n=1 Tax=Streptomyces sp. NPDC086077 TaxID=3154862 RepID=UPI00343F7666
MNAWWSLMVKAAFEPALGGYLFAALTADLPVDESPSPAPGPTERARRPVRGGPCHEARRRPAQR